VWIFAKILLENDKKKKSDLDSQETKRKKRIPLVGL